jgi:transcriptional regulator with XRE-family HTH domain
MFCDRAKLASLRQGKGFKQQTLAHMARVDLRTIQRMEAGEKVSRGTLNQVAGQLGVTASELLCNIDESFTVLPMGFC